MKIVLYCAGAVLLAAVTASCGVDSGRAAASRRCEKLLKLNPANAAEDARRAKAQGDVRLLAVYGYSQEFPGVNGDAQAIARAHGVRMIAGTSDAIASQRCGELNKDARDYAARYNKLILQ